MKQAATVLVTILGMAGGAWGQSLLDASGSGPNDPPRPVPFKKHDSIQILVQARSRAPRSDESRPADLTLAIAAEVADVRPNGTLVLQAIRRRQVNGEEETIRLTAEVAPQSIVDRKVLSDKLMNMNLVYSGRGSESP